MKKRFVFSFIVLISSLAYADINDDFFQPGPSWSERVNPPGDSSRNATGFSHSGAYTTITNEQGQVKGYEDVNGNFYDKEMRLIVHEGNSPWSRQDAADYVRKYNR